MSVFTKGQATVATVTDALSSQLNLLHNIEISQEYTEETDVYLPDYTDSNLTITPSLSGNPDDEIDSISYTANGKAITSTDSDDGIYLNGNNLKISQNIGELDLGQVSTTDMTNKFLALESEMLPIVEAEGEIPAPANLLSALEDFNVAKQGVIDALYDVQPESANLLDFVWETMGASININGNVVRATSTASEYPRIRSNISVEDGFKQGDYYTLRYDVRGDSERYINSSSGNGLRDNSTPTVYLANAVNVTTEWQTVKVTGELPVDLDLDNTFVQLYSSEVNAVNVGSWCEYRNVILTKSSTAYSWRPSINDEETLIEDSESTVTSAVANEVISTTERDAIIPLWNEIKTSYTAWVEASKIFENVINIKASAVIDSNTAPLEATIALSMTKDVGSVPQTVIIAPNGKVLKKFDEVLPLYAKMMYGSYEQTNTTSQPNNVKFTWYRDDTTIVSRSESTNVLANTLSGRTKFTCRTVSRKGRASESSIVVYPRLKGYKTEISTSKSEVVSVASPAQTLKAELFYNGTKLTDAEMAGLSYQWYKLNDSTVYVAMQGKTSRTLEISPTEEIESYQVEISN